MKASWGCDLFDERFQLFHTFGSKCLAHCVPKPDMFFSIAVNRNR